MATFRLLKVWVALRATAATTRCIEHGLPFLEAYAATAPLNLTSISPGRDEIVDTNALDNQKLAGTLLLAMHIVRRLGGTAQPGV